MSKTPEKQQIPTRRGTKSGTLAGDFLLEVILGGVEYQVREAPEPTMIVNGEPCDVFVDDVERTVAMPAALAPSTAYAAGVMNATRRAALCPELADVVNAWPTLSPPVRAAVLAVVRSGKG